MASADPMPAFAPSSPAPRTSSRTIISVKPDTFLADAAALNAAVRLGDPSAVRFQPDATLSGYRTAPPSITLRYHLANTGGLSPYIAGTLASMVAAPSAGGMSLSLHNGAAIAFGLDTDASGHSRMNFDIGVKHALMPGKMLDHRSVDPWVMGAGFGMKF